MSMIMDYDGWQCESCCVWSCGLWCQPEATTRRKKDDHEEEEEEKRKVDFGGIHSRHDWA